VTPAADGSAEARLRAAGLAVRAGHRIVSLAERPDLVDPSDHFNGGAWPPFMLESPIANGLFGRCFTDSYVVARATSPVRIDHERDVGVYHDENVWMVHDLA
jgi:hypothetical protein